VEEALRRYNISYTMVAGSAFTSARDQGHARLPAAGAQSPRLDGAATGDQHTGPRYCKTTLETLERLALETGQSTWEALGRYLEPAHSFAGADGDESFRQLILDAQAMMDPDFAGKLSSDVAPDEDADTGSRMAPPDRSRQPGRGQRRLGDKLDSAATRTRFPCLTLQPTLHLPSSQAAVPRHAKKKADAESQLEAKEGSEETPAFRAPGDAATLPELIRFLIDRTGYIKALETEGSPEAFSRSRI